MGKYYFRLQTPDAPVGPIVFMYRDPRDTVVSFFHQMTKRQPIPFGRKLRFSLAGKMPPTSLDGFARSARFGIEKTIVFNLQCAECLPAHPVTCERMRANPVQALSEILAHVGHEVPQIKIRTVVERNSFEKCAGVKRQAHSPGNSETSRRH